MVLLHLVRLLKRKIRKKIDRPLSSTVALASAVCRKQLTYFLEKDFVNGKRQSDGCLGCMQMLVDSTSSFSWCKSSNRVTFPTIATFWEVLQIDTRRVYAILHFQLFIFPISDSIRSYLIKIAEQKSYFFVFSLKAWCSYMKYKNN